MIKTIINIKQNQIIFLWENGSMSWLPLDKYEFDINEDYSVIVLSENTEEEGYREPKVINGSFLIELLKKQKEIL